MTPMQMPGDIQKRTRKRISEGVPSALLENIETFSDNVAMLVDVINSKEAIIEDVGALCKTVDDLEGKVEEFKGALAEHQIEWEKPEIKDSLEVCEDYLNRVIEGIDKRYEYAVDEADKLFTVIDPATSPTSDVKRLEALINSVISYDKAYLELVNEEGRKEIQERLEQDQKLIEDIEKIKEKFADELGVDLAPELIEVVPDVSEEDAIEISGKYIVRKAYLKDDYDNAQSDEDLKKIAESLVEIRQGIMNDAIVIGKCSKGNALVDLFAKPSLSVSADVLFNKLKAKDERLLRLLETDSVEAYLKEEDALELALQKQAEEARNKQEEDQRKAEEARKKEEEEKNKSIFEKITHSMGFGKKEEPKVEDAPVQELATEEQIEQAVELDLPESNSTDGMVQLPDELFTKVAHFTFKGAATDPMNGSIDIMELADEKRVYREIQKVYNDENLPYDAKKAIAAQLGDLGQVIGKGFLQRQGENGITSDEEADPAEMDAFINPLCEKLSKKFDNFDAEKWKQHWRNKGAEKRAAIEEVIEVPEIEDLMAQLEGDAKETPAEEIVETPVEESSEQSTEEKQPTVVEPEEEIVEEPEIEAEVLALQEEEYSKFTPGIKSRGSMFGLKHISEITTMDEIEEDRCICPKCGYIVQEKENCSLCKSYIGTE